jgi:hypothetical protein
MIGTDQSVHEILSLERTNNEVNDVKIKVEGQKQTNIHVDPSKVIIYGSNTEYCIINHIILQYTRQCYK